MRLKRFLIRYFPPGIALEYTQNEETKTKMLELFDLSQKSDVNEMAETLAKSEPLITPSVMPQLRETLLKIQNKMIEVNNKRFQKHKVLKTHILPLTNIAFDKNGTRCLTGSYDRTCKVWDVDNGIEIHTLEGHKSVVYTVGFNQPYCTVLTKLRQIQTLRVWFGIVHSDRILTGSFDNTAKVWCADSGVVLRTLWGHTAEVVATQFNNTGDVIVTGSMDNTVRLFDVATGQERGTLLGHTAEVISVHFNNNGNQAISGSFDHTVNVWDTRTNSRTGVLIGHHEEISNSLYNYDCSLIASSSIDKTAKVWDPRTFTCLASIMGHDNEVLDIAFDSQGRRLATASSDSTARVWDVSSDFHLLALMAGHKEEVSKVSFSPAGSQLLTTSNDKTARLWSTDTGCCLQVLQGHTDEVFSGAFSYSGEVIVTASKDNTCRIWR